MSNHPPSHPLRDVVLLALLALAPSAGCRSSEARTVPAASPRPVRSIQVAPPTEGTALTFPGRVRAEAQPALSFRVSGRINRLLVDVGAKVEKGQPLGELDRSDYATRTARAQAEVAQAKADAGRTARAASRAARLFAAQAVSEAERDESRDLAAAAAARLSSAEQRLALARRELSYTRLFAPRAGVVVARSADPGANVASGQSILQLVGRELEVRADVPESILRRARKGARASVRLPAHGPGFLPAQVIRAAEGAADGGVLFPVSLRLDAVPEGLMPGLAAEVRFEGSSPPAPDTVALPSAALLADAEGTYVWRLEADDDDLFVARRQMVTVLSFNGNPQVAAAHLEIGTRVVTAGSSYLHEGQRVRLAQQAPQVFEGRLERALR